MPAKYLVAAGLLASALARTPAAVQSPPEHDGLPALLERAALYVDSFEQSFVRVIGTERSQQTLRTISGRGSARMRQLESEIFFLGIGSDGPSWMTVRNVLKVDGKAIADSHEHIMAALSGDAGDKYARLRALANEGSRFNLGSVVRNFNDPALALTFLDADLQGRFRFTLDGRSSLNGVEVNLVRFREDERPTLIRDEVANRDAPASGLLFITDAGTVLQSELNVSTRSDTTAAIKVRYRLDSRLKMYVPSEMDEDYRSGTRDNVILISGHAEYSDYKRFDTSIRILQ